MYDHVGLRVEDLRASTRFYEAALKPLGFVQCSADASAVSFGPAGEPVLWLYPAQGSAGPGAHIAFRASDRSMVDQVHAGGLEAGGRDNGPPGLRLDYSPTYYASFLLDPDGNNVEVVSQR
jgi:catechol 2,3-dioxygenase-like lactoylglutathione lyase family enzyme